MNWTSRVIAAALTKKGFKEVAGGDHRHFWLYRNGRKTNIFTKISNGNDEYDHKGRVFSAMKNTVATHHIAVERPLQLPNG